MTLRQSFCSGIVKDNMLNNQSNLTIPGGNSPEEATEAPNNPRTQDKDKEPKEGDIRKVDKEAFDDSFESQEEDQISTEEAESEKAKRPGA